jgi:formylglycine-generating enzyme required for sulfatase activity
VFRGGAWDTIAAGFRTAKRSSFLLSYRDFFVGFRVVRNCEQREPVGADKPRNDR